MSTSPRAWLALAVTVGVTALSCAGRGSTSGGPSEALNLQAVAADQHGILLEPNQQGTVAFKLDNGGVPAAGRRLSFTIVAGDPTAPQGATLSSPTGVTDPSGVATVGVHAGSGNSSFSVRAQIGAANAQVDVIVKTGATGTLLVAPFFLSMDAPGATNTIRVLLYEDKSCETLDPDDPPAASRAPYTLAVGDANVTIPFVSTGAGSSVYVQAIGPGPTVIATGCVDVPGSTLLSGGTVEVEVPLADAVPDPVGTFSLTSTMTFAPPLAAAAAVARPWEALSDCPLDPAQLWLDCATDALSTSAADPLDCVPAASEGPVGDAIAARRGAWLVDGTGAATSCRGARDGQASESLDAVVQGLFGSPSPAGVVALPAIAADAASILSSVRLTSSLAVAPGAQSGSYVVTHTLESALFGPAGAVPVPLAPLGAPVLQAVTSASLNGGTLNVARHGFTLRLGSAARVAFGQLALAPRGFPADAAGFVGALFAAARGPSGASGCGALDATVCPAAGLPAGCLTNACAAGLSTMARLLDGAFSAADGTGLDLQLAGTAPLVAVPGSLRTLRLGAGETQSSTGAAWTASVETSLDDVTLIAPFEGPRE